MRCSVKYLWDCKSCRESLCFDFWICSYLIVLPLWFKISNPILRTSSFSIVTWSWSSYKRCVLDLIEGKDKFLWRILIGSHSPLYLIALSGPSQTQLICSYPFGKLFLCQKNSKLDFFFRFGFQIINVSLTNKLVVVLHFFVGFHFSVSEDKLKLKPNQSREAASTKVGYIIWV
jgi:hypothetical protein